MGTAIHSPLQELFASEHGLCVSIYQPTFRAFPDRQQNPVRFRNLVREAARSLTERIGDDETAAFLEPLHALMDSRTLWDHPQDGLAVFRASGFLRFHKVQRALPERVIVADSFHTKPLLRVTQSADRFEVLAVTRQHVRLFQGNRDQLDEVTLDPHVPRTLVDALGDQLTEQHQTASSYQSGGPGMGGGQGGYNVYGVGSRKDELDKDVERFFRIVDRAVADHHSRHSRLPLLLAALPEHHALFHSVSHNAALLDAPIAVNPDALAADELRQRAWAAFEPRYLARLAELVEAFGTARAHGQGSDQLAEIALAAIGGRVRTLLVEADRVVPGRIVRETGEVETAPLSDAFTDDLLDDLAEHTLRAGGEVVVVPAARMPVTTGAAATYRF
jgi:hypothetical protein